MMILLKKFFLIFVLYTVLFKLELVIYPTSVSILYGMLGLIIFLISGSDRKRLSRNNGVQYASLKHVIKIAMPILLIALFSGFINPGTDWYFVKYFGSIILAFFSGYLVTYIMFKIHGEITFSLIVRYIVICNYIYISLAVLAFVLPAFSNLVMNIMRIEEGQEAALMRTEGFRLQCVGVSFFNGGVIEGFINILIAIVVCFVEKNENKHGFYLFSFAFFAVFATMIARTSLIGSFIGGALLMWYKFRTHIRVLITYAIAISLLVVITMNVLVDYLKEYNDMLRWAFELFITYHETGEFTTTSAGYMFAMYDIVPDNLKTWMIGDALWQNKDGIGFYQGTDIGVFRCIWYFGLIGLSIYMLYTKKYLKLFFYRHFMSHSAKIVQISFFVYLVIIMFKGFFDLFPLCVYFYFCTTTNNNEIINN